MENYGFLSILPIIIAVAMAIKTKNVILSLFSSVFIGVLILLNYNPVITTKTLMTDYFVKQLTDSYNAGVIVLMLFIGGFIELMMRSGGAYAFAQSVGKLINSKTKAQLAAYLAGIIIFFSDLGTPLIVGPIFAPFFKKLKVSKEKLAFILDSTSSPIAVLVPFIGWGVFIIGLLQKEFELLNLNISDYEAFIKSIPFNIYPILALIIVPALALLKLDFGPMKKAEENIDKDIEVEIKEKKEYIVENAKPIYVWLPILILLVTLFGMLGYDFMFKRFSGSEFRAALSSGYLYAAIALALMMLINKSKSFEEIFTIYLTGITKMTQIAIILILAWSLGTVNKNLGSANYIVNFMKSIDLASGFIPAIAFILGCIISFATGSSWGTYSIMIPIVIPMAFTLNAPLYITIGAILSGGLFGDHCSPISDTTILASAGSGCSHIEHVRTQIFYAIINGILSFIGFLVGGFFQNYIILLICIIVQLTLLIIIKIKQKN
ncbi:Na+/H+ antiporter NhaC family protein [uncultured Fusobacterium sp.]|uniref:Na+/H+ antiporter NhaC family protein n=1 Tax=uncultured Fusobacterium sp. TaxID=159267 RepID=UPI0025FADC8E|nr:Na+/H+ antiporter NhaC family protein [uncultured Fusobacterium sp.]